MSLRMQASKGTEAAPGGRSGARWGRWGRWGGSRCGSIPRARHKWRVHTAQRVAPPEANGTAGESRRREERAWRYEHGRDGGWMVIGKGSGSSW